MSAAMIAAVLIMAWLDSMSRNAWSSGMTKPATGARLSASTSASTYRPNKPRKRRQFSTPKKNNMAPPRV